MQKMDGMQITSQHSYFKKNQGSLGSNETRSGVTKTSRKRLLGTQSSAFSGRERPEQRVAPSAKPVLQGRPVTSGPGGETSLPLSPALCCQHLQPAWTPFLEKEPTCEGMGAPAKGQTVRGFEAE